MSRETDLIWDGIDEILESAFDVKHMSFCPWRKREFLEDLKSERADESKECAPDRP
jgi:hypothetical protein